MDLRLRDWFFAPDVRERFKRKKAELSVGSYDPHMDPSKRAVLRGFMAAAVYAACGNSDGLERLANDPLSGWLAEDETCREHHEETARGVQMFLGVLGSSDAHAA